MTQNLLNNYRKQKYEQIVSKMADFIIEDEIDDCTISVFKYATDLNKCDYIDVQIFVGLLDIDVVPSENETFSIKKFNKDNKFYASYNRDPFEQLVKDNWQDWLDEDEVEFIEDSYNVACVTDKYCYGGGGFEFIADFAIDVAKKIEEFIKGGAK